MAKLKYRKDKNDTFKELPIIVTGGTDSARLSQLEADVETQSRKIEEVKLDIGLVENVLNKTITSNNVFNKNTITKNKIIYSNGSIADNETHFITDFIKVPEGKNTLYMARLTNTGEFSTHVADGNVSQYDENKTFIMNKPNANTVSLGSNCKYIRVSLANSWLDYLLSLSFDVITNENITQAGECSFEVIDDYARNELDGIKSKIKEVALYSTSFLRYPLLSGIRTDFYFEDIACGMADKFSGFWSGNAQLNADSVSIKPTDSSTQNIIAIHAIPNYQTDTYEFIDSQVAVVNVKSTDGTGTKKVLLIGDSFTDQGKYQKYVDDYFKENTSMSVEWLGSRTSGFGLQHEGRSGWRAYTYTNKAQVSSASENDGMIATNPFWNPSTNKFDFNYYMAQQGYDGVDIVFINLGINDVARGNHDSKEELLSYWKTIVDSIKAYNSDIKIVLWLCPQPCLLNGKGTVRQALQGRYKMRNVILDQWRKGSWGNNGIYILPVYLSIDPYYDFPIEEVSKDDLNTEIKIKRATDVTHLSDNGYKRLSYPIAAMIKYLAK